MSSIRLTLILLKTRVHLQKLDEFALYICHFDSSLICQPEHCSTPWQCCILQSLLHLFLQVFQYFVEILNFLMIFVMFMFWNNTQKGSKVINTSFFHITHVFFQKQFSAYKDKRKQKGDPKLKSRIKSKIMKLIFIFPQLFKMHLMSKSAKNYHLSPKKTDLPPRTKDRE